MKKCSTLSFKGQMIYCGRDLDNFSINPASKGLADYLKKKYQEAEYRSVYEACFNGFEAHRALCALGIFNIVINLADVPTSGRDRE